MVERTIQKGGRMQIVIDIPEKLIELAQTELVMGGDMPTIANAISNGIVLPKGHGRLIDADAFIKTMEGASKRQKYKELLIDDLLTVDDVFKAVIESLRNEGLAEGDAPTIIEADKAESEE